MWDFGVTTGWITMKSNYLHDSGKLVEINFVMELLI